MEDSFVVKKKGSFPLKNKNHVKAKGKGRKLLLSFLLPSLLTGEFEFHWPSYLWKRNYQGRWEVYYQGSHIENWRPAQSWRTGKCVRIARGERRSGISKFQKSHRIWIPPVSKKLYSVWCMFGGRSSSKSKVNLSHRQGLTAQHAQCAKNNKRRR